MNTKKLFSALAIMATISAPILFTSHAQASDRYYQKHDRYSYYEGYRDARHDARHERHERRHERRHQRHHDRHHYGHRSCNHRRHHDHHGYQAHHGRHHDYATSVLYSGIELIFKF